MSIELTSKWLLKMKDFYKAKKNESESEEWHTDIHFDGMELIKNEVGNKN